MSGQDVVKRDGYRRDLHPLPGEAELDRLAGLWDLVKPFAYGNQVTVAAAAGTVSAFVTSREGRGREGVLVAFAFDLGIQDYTQAPVTIEDVDLKQDGTAQDAGSGNIRPGGGPFKCQVGALTTPFIVPFPIPLKADRQIALVTKNGTGAPFDAKGFIYGITWSKDATRDVRRALWGMRNIDIWQSGLFTKGGGR